MYFPKIEQYQAGPETGESLQGDAAFLMFYFCLEMTGRGADGWTGAFPHQGLNSNGVIGISCQTEKRREPGRVWEMWQLKNKNRATGEFKATGGNSGHDS